MDNDFGDIEMHDVIIVGGGIAGLTAAAYLSRSEYQPLLLEKETKCGGLISSFEHDGFMFDGGIRATENSGILFPMIKQLGLDLEFVDNEISLGVEDQVIRIRSNRSINENIVDYQNLLNYLYPQSQNEISEIIKQMTKITKYMEIQYGIDNPALLDFKENLGYLITRILPWMVKYALTVPRINRLHEPVIPFLEKFTQNRALIDIITQHFFEDIPTYFALSYMRIYADYYYPLGGTGALPQQLSAFIQEHGGSVKTNTQITAIDPIKKYLIDSEGNDHRYDQLIWAADQTMLYQLIQPELFVDEKIKHGIIHRQQELKGKLGNDSILTVYLAVNTSPEYFSEKSTGHFFYTSSRRGISSGEPVHQRADRNVIENWMRQYATLTTYEISIPVLRDPHLAPSGKTGLIISTPFNYHLTRHIQDQGWYEDFQTSWEALVINVLDRSIYPGLKNAVLHCFSSTPITIEKRTANTHGAITGWAFTNDPIPAENRLTKIFSSTATPIPDIVQAGHWTYSPSGMPISILTGKLAADRVTKNLKKKTS